MNIKSINKQVKGSSIYMKAFAGAKSTQLNHYVLPTLDAYNNDAAIIYVGINDILRSKNPDDLIDLRQNVIKVEKSVRIIILVNIYIRNNSIVRRGVKTPHFKNNPPHFG